MHDACIEILACIMLMYYEITGFGFFVVQLFHVSFPYVAFLYRLICANYLPIFRRNIPFIVTNCQACHNKLA